MNERQRRFAQHYAATGNATEAAELAGYSPDTARAQGSRLLTNVNVKNYIAELQEEAEEGRVASLREVKTFWSCVMSDENEKTTDRLKASELLARSAGMFATKKVDATQDAFGLNWGLIGGDSDAG